jgi:hypothetical protein
MELREKDIERVVAALPDYVVQVMKNDELYLAGGFVRDIIRGAAPHDIDLFGPYDLMANAERRLQDLMPEGTQIHRTPWAVTFVPPTGLKVQIVTGFPVTHPVDLLDRFNFTVNQATVYWDFDYWSSECAWDFYPDLAAKRLVYVNGQTPSGAAKTIEKTLVFVSEGWQIDLENMMTVVAAAAITAEGGGVVDDLKERLMANARGEGECTTKDLIVQTASSESVDHSGLSAADLFPTLRDRAIAAYTF